MARDRLNALGNSDRGYGQQGPRNHGANHDYIPMDHINNGYGNQDGRHGGNQDGRHDGRRDRSASNASRGNGRQFEYAQNYAGGGADGSLDNRFFGLFDRVTEHVAELEVDIRGIESRHNRILEAGKGPRYVQESKELERYEEHLKDKITRIKNQLKELDRYVQDPRGQDLTQSQAIQRKARKQALTKRFADLIARYKQIQGDFARNQRRHVEREYRIAFPNATEEQVYQAVSSGAHTNIYQQAVLHNKDNQTQAAKRVLMDVEQRQRQIENIEKSIVQLAEMFQEVSEMVHQQQEQIDNIESAVEATHVDIEEGVKETHHAIVQRKKSRKKCWILIALLIILIAIVAVVVYVKVCGGGKCSKKDP
ncbi:hypothetical protein GGF40_002877 [Coemansia sp. RSA 1286]|nr:hypothetical protein GGF40_002877 [Coemansia sp. RSA 1286]